MLRYLQKSGEISVYFNDGTDWGWTWLGDGYSGNGVDVNNPAAETVVDKGPIPAGIWSLSFPYNDPHRGENCFRLTPLTYKGPRSGFLIHADNVKGDRSASSGCIILSPTIRQSIVDSKQTYLIVEAE